MALTTTTGFCGSRPLTISAARSIALASCTEVPPNFMTIIGSGTSAADERDQTSHFCRIGTCCSSPQVSPHFEQLRVQQSRARRASNGVVGKHGEFPVEDATWPQTADRSRHAIARVNIEPRLRPVSRNRVLHGLFRRAGQLQFLGHAAEFVPRLEHLFRTRFRV